MLKVGDKVCFTMEGLEYVLDRAKRGTSYTWNQPAFHTYSMDTVGEVDSCFIQNMERWVFVRVGGDVPRSWPESYWEHVDSGYNKALTLLEA